MHLRCGGCTSSGIRSHRHVSRRQVPHGLWRGHGECHHSTLPVGNLSSQNSRPDGGITWVHTLRRLCTIVPLLPLLSSSDCHRGLQAGQDTAATFSRTKSLNGGCAWRCRSCHPFVSLLDLHGCPSLLATSLPTTNKRQALPFSSVCITQQKTMRTRSLVSSCTRSGDSSSSKSNKVGARAGPRAGCCCSKESRTESVSSLASYCCK